MLTIEFLGPPGSGKSTLHAEAIRWLRGNGTDAVDLDEAARRAIALSGRGVITRSMARNSTSANSKMWKRAFARSADRTSALTRFHESNRHLIDVIEDSQRERRGRDLEPELVLRWVHGLMTRYQLATETSDHIDLLVIDEGFAQRAIAIFAAGFKSDDRPALAAYVEAIPKPDVLVVVETPLDDCRDRLDQSSWSDRLSNTGRGERLQFLRNTYDITESVVIALQKAETETIWVSGTTPAPDAIAQLAATLSNG